MDTLTVTQPLGHVYARHDLMIELGRVDMAIERARNAGAIGDHAVLKDLLEQRAQMEHRLKAMPRSY